MPYIHVEDFRGGVDRTRRIVAGTPGTLWTGTNCHITRGGEIEKRKSFVSTYTLPAGTVGLAAAMSTLYVFGSGADPGVPSGVTYQRLQHPDSGRTLSAIVDWDVFDGKIYVVGEFDDGSVHHYYDGAIVTDWRDGVVRTGQVDLATVAEALKALIDADADYTATRASNVITVTGPSGEAFAVTTLAANGEGNAADDQAMATVTTQSAVAGVAEVVATGALTVTGGTAATPSQGSVELTGGASGSVDGITVNGVQIMSGAEAFDGDLDTTAQNVVDNINAFTSSPNYTATRTNSTINIFAATALGDSPNGFAVVSSTSTITSTDTNMAGGADKGVSAVTVDGVDILGAQVNYTSSNSVLAANIASQINSYSSTPEYTATASGNVVTISAAAGTGDGPNGFVVTAALDSGITATYANMSGGVDAVAGQAQISTLTLSGTFEAGDRYGVTLGEKTFGAVAKPTGAAAAVLTHKSKVHAAAGSLVHFSGVDTPAGWSRDAVDGDTGAGFLSVASQSGGAQTLTGLGVYQEFMAIFARRAIQIWSIDVDPTLNVFQKPLNGSGTRAPGSIVEFGSIDLFYLSDNGVRSLRARDSSGAAFVSDIGNPIDALIKDALGSLTSAQIASAIGILEPEDNRFWLALGSTIYVFSYFRGSDISAWSTYEAPGEVAGLVSVDDKVYLRSGNTIYRYGGSDGATYDTSTVTVLLPFLTAGRPATDKYWYGFGAALSNTWRVDLLVDPDDTNDFLRIGDLSGTTYLGPQDGVEHTGTHAAPRLVCTEAGEAAISNLTLHYEMAGGD